MGQSKALLPLGPGETFLTRIVRTFQQAQIDDVVIVLGHDPERTRESVLARGLAPRFVLNPRFESGQLSSLLTGLNAIDRPGVAAMLLTLVDVPLVSPATVRAVVAHYHATRAPIVRPVNGALHGHPIVVDRSLFGLMRAADPAAGAKPIVRAHATPAGDITVDDDGAFVDIDTPDEYARVLERLEAG
jgi:CTP:molybdopterin cytidylyltransferase MocA